MPVFAPTLPQPSLDGLAYCTAAVVPTTEGDLAAPVPTLYGQAASAVVELTANGATAPTYVIMQTDFGDGVFVDVAWGQTSIVTGTATFVLSLFAQGPGAFQQTRAAGTAPGGTGTNPLAALGGRIRFVGQTGKAASPSPSPSPSPAGPPMLATIRLRFLGLR
jgi:hypothetical protein